MKKAKEIDTETFKIYYDLSSQTIPYYEDHVI